MTQKIRVGLVGYGVGKAVANISALTRVTTCAGLHGARQLQNRNAPGY